MQHGLAADAAGVCLRPVDDVHRDERQDEVLLRPNRSSGASGGPEFVGCLNID